MSVASLAYYLRRKLSIEPSLYERTHTHTNTEDISHAHSGTHVCPRMREECVKKPVRTSLLSAVLRVVLYLLYMRTYNPDFTNIDI